MLVKFCCKWILLFLTVIMSVTFRGCGYSEEEKIQMQKYENQASENAVNYISEKYGFQANVLAAYCEKMDSSGVPDPWPRATGDVLVGMEYDGDKFLVMISGEEATRDGSDNYQLEQIKKDSLEKMNVRTGCSAIKIDVKYGRRCRRELDFNDNGLIHTYYDGNNLSEVFSEYKSQMVYSCVGVDLSMIDAEVIKELVGGVEILLVSYRSQDDFESAGRSCFNLGGMPLAYNIEDKAIYIDEYRVIYGDYEEHVVYDLREHDGIYYVPKAPDAQVILTETVLDDASNWNGHGFINVEQILDTAYEIYSESDVIYFFIPVDMLEVGESTDAVGKIAYIAYQYEGEEGTEYSSEITSLSDDGRYLVGTIYMRDYSGLKISVLRNNYIEE